MIKSFTGKYSFLSNFSPVPVSYEGIMYPSAEHAFQAAKTLCETERIAISKIPYAGKAKTAGRKLTLRPNWDEIKLGIMLEILRKKFSLPDLAAKLKATAPEPLVEENYWNDRFWGQCGGTGENHLGKLLMQVRSELHGIYHDLACSLCGHSPIYKEDPKDRAPTKFYCHNCERGFNEAKKV